jgi:cytochrome P450 family 135
MVLDPQSVRDMVTCPPGALISGRGNAVLRFLYGSSSLFLVDGPPHHRLRRLLVPPFRNRDTLAELRAHHGKRGRGACSAHLPRNRPFALLPELRHGMLEIILRVVFGLSDETPAGAVPRSHDGAAGHLHLARPPACVRRCARSATA